MLRASSRALSKGASKRSRVSLRRPQVIDVTSIEKTGKVIFGTTVRLINVDTEEAQTYQIVGDDEADIKQGRLSISSPIARALIGKEEGEEVSIQVPSGTVEYEIEEVLHQ